MSRNYSVQKSPLGPPSDEKIDEMHALSDGDADKFNEIQDLLVGDLRREAQTRISELEARIQALETNIVRRLESLETRISEVSFRNEEHQQRTIDEVSRGMGELSERLKNVKP